MKREAFFSRTKPDINELMRACSEEKCRLTQILVGNDSITACPCLSGAAVGGYPLGIGEKRLPHPGRARHLKVAGLTQIREKRGGGW
jgi:hypothetical protein